MNEQERKAFTISLLVAIVAATAATAIGYLSINNNERKKLKE